MSPSCAVGAAPRPTPPLVPVPGLINRVPRRARARSGRGANFGAGPPLGSWRCGLGMPRCFALHPLSACRRTIDIALLGRDLQRPEESILGADSASGAALLYSSARTFCDQLHY